jgi:hypothetical protein
MNKEVKKLTHDYICGNKRVIQKSRENLTQIYARAVEQIIHKWK